MPNNFIVDYGPIRLLCARTVVWFTHYFSAHAAPRRFFGLILLILSQFSLAAVDFTVIDLTGRIHTLSHYQGKWVLINFWASWCPICIQEIPELNAFHARPDGVVLGLNIHDQLSNQLLQQVATHYAIAYPIARATNSTRRAFGSVRGLPTTFLINPAGILIARYSGGITHNVIERLIRAHPLSPPLQ